jgi:hypothetical protein
VKLFGIGRPEAPPEEPLTGNKRTGQQGEEIAAGFLIARGYHILERNFRCKGGEVDIIATLLAPDGHHQVEQIVNAFELAY